LNPLGADYFNTLGICAISVWRTFLSTAAALARSAALLVV
jgi:hypothetical protein